MNIENFDDVVETDAFLRHLEDLALTVLGKPVSIKRIDEGVACTNGNTIFLNVKNKIVVFFATARQKYMAQVGVLFHECAHMLFFDFDAAAQVREKLGKGKLPHKKLMKDPTAIEAELAESSVAEVYTQALMQLDNCVSDAHDEVCICEVSGGENSFVARAIDHSTESLWSTCPPLEKLMKENIKPTEKLKLLYQLSLELARFGEINVIYKSTLNTEIPKAIEPCMPFIENAVCTDEARVKYENLNRVCELLFPYIKDAIQDEQKQNGGSKSDAAKSVADAMQQAAAPLASEQPKGTGKPRLSPSSSNKDQNSTPHRQKTSAERKESIAASQGKEDGKSQMEQVTQDAKRDQQEMEQEEADKQDLMIQVDTADMASSHKGIPVRIKRPLQITEADEQRCRSIMNEVGAYSKRLQKYMLELLRNATEGFVVKHKFYGNGMNAHEAYRPDGAFFYNKKAPQDVPNMAVSVLVDQSGSMHGVRMEAARKAATLLYDFCSGIHVPVCVAGHNTSGGVTYTVFADFDHPSKRDLVRISKLSTGGANRDGLAINLSADRLAKRPEEMKLLFIICDGQPCDNNYGGEPARKDIQEIVRKYKRKGVETIVLAIGSDKEKIEEIYGNFIDISDLSTLPKKLVSMVSKRIFK